MGRTILCPHCKSTINEDILRQKNSENTCLVCGGRLDAEEDNTVPGLKKGKTKWYYYKEGGGMLDNTLSSRFTPVYTFEAVDMDDAERQLKEVLPNSPLFNQGSSSKVQCPYCFGTEIQLIPKKFSILTGFATNSYNRVCVRCQRKF